MKAYIDLENEGILESRPQSGFYVSADKNIPEIEQEDGGKITVSSVDKFSMIYSVCNAMADKSLIQFGGATPCMEHLPSKELSKTIKNILNYSEDFYYVEDFRGNKALRNAISYQMLSAGTEISSDDIVITTGATESLCHILRVLTSKGDCIASESPMHFAHIHALETLGLKLIEIPSRPDRGIDPDRLEEALKTYNVKALLLQPNFSNPLGGSLTEEDKQKVVDICASREVPIIEDDVYGELCHEGHRPKSLSAFDKKGNVIFISSFSKTISPSFRVGWIHTGKYFKDVMDKKISTVLDTARIPQLAIGEYLSTGKFSRFLTKIRRIYKNQTAAYRSAIVDCFPEGTRVSNPKGSYLLWVEMPESVDSFSLYKAALREKIGVVPGFLFTAQDKYRNYVRLNCGNPLNEKHLEALRKLGYIAKSIKAEPGVQP
jgi:DNA-binding transcriptional MocR family regulator